MLKKKQQQKDNRDPYEAAAERFLLLQGLTLIERNFTIPCGEIDLIMKTKEQVIVFIEVKYRKHNRYGTGIEAITKKKQEKLFKAANYFLVSHKLINHAACRFDIVSIGNRQETNEFTFDWLINAIEQRY